MAELLVPLNGSVKTGSELEFEFEEIWLVDWGLEKVRFFAGRCVEPNRAFSRF